MKDYTYTKALKLKDLKELDVAILLTNVNEEKARLTKFGKYEDKLFLENVIIQYTITLEEEKDKEFLITFNTTNRSATRCRETGIVFIHDRFANDKQDLQNLLNYNARYIEAIGILKLMAEEEGWKILNRMAEAEAK